MKIETKDQAAVFMLQEAERAEQHANNLTRDINLSQTGTAISILQAQREVFLAYGARFREVVKVLWDLPDKP